jgi:hypothetical protein
MTICCYCCPSEGSSPMGHTCIRPQPTVYKTSTYYALAHMSSVSGPFLRPLPKQSLPTQLKPLSLDPSRTKNHANTRRTLPAIIWSDLTLRLDCRWKDGRRGSKLTEKIQAIIATVQNHLGPQLGAVFGDCFGEEGVRRWKGVRDEYADHAGDWFTAQEEESTKAVTMNAMAAVMRRHLAAATANLLLTDREEAGGTANQVQPSLGQRSQEGRC